MLIAALLIVALLVSTALHVQLLRMKEREHHRERQMLIAQLLHATGKTWTTPPAEEQRWLERQRESRESRARVQWISPEQQPVE